MDMDVVWEKIKKSLKDGAVMSVEKIEEYTKIGKLKVDEMSAKRKIERNFLDIGERFYDLSQDGREGEASGDLAVKKALANIAALYAEIAEITEKIKEVHRAAKKASGDAGGDEESDSETGDA